MQKVTTAAQMRSMDRIAMHGIYAIAPAVLMENAGHAVALLRCGVLHRGEQSYGDSCRTENEFSFHG